MGINRFMTPAELPKVSFFQLPYEQMKEGIMSAQMQQDAAREGITGTLDASFNYLTNSKIDPELAKNIYSELDSKGNAILSKQGNGDLRGLRGEIYNLGKEVGRWYKPDGKIGRLQSNYLQYNDWYKRQVENKDLDPKYVQDAAQAIIREYDAKGGAKAGGIYTEDLKKHFDYSKFVNDNKDMIKSTLIERERDILGNNGYKYTDEQIQKFITPEKIMYTMSEILQSNPEHLSSLQQRIRFGNLPKESEPTLIQKGKDKNGQPIYDLNPYSPASTAIHGAMTGLGGVEEDRTRFSIGNDEGYWKMWDYQHKDEGEPLIEGNYGETLGTTQDYVNKIQNNYTGTPEQNSILMKANAPLAEVVAKHVLNSNGEIRSEFSKYFKDTKDLNGKIIPKEEILQGFVLSLHDPSYNGGHGVWTNDDIMKTYLTSKGYKINATWSDGPLKKIMSLYSGLYGNSTDLDNVNSLVRDEVNGVPFPADSKEISALFSDLRKRQKDLINQPPVSLQTPLKIVPPNSKNPIYKVYQNLASLKTIADSYNFINESTGEAGPLASLLENNAFDKDVTVAFSTTDPNNRNPNEPQRHFLILQPINKKGQKEGPSQKIEITSKTPGTQNQIAAGASNALYNNKMFFQRFQPGNYTGVNAAQNLINATDSSLIDQDRKNFGQ